MRLCLTYFLEPSWSELELTFDDVDTPDCVDLTWSAALATEFCPITGYQVRVKSRTVAKFNQLHQSCQLFHTCLFQFQLDCEDAIGAFNTTNTTELSARLCGFSPGRQVDCNITAWNRDTISQTFFNSSYLDCVGKRM